MIEWKYIMAPVIGGLIGLITNGIAIKMLFRPLHPVKLGKFTLPFTPGLIPKEQPRIAHAIGKVIGDELLDAQTLQKALASETLQKALDQKIDRVIEKIGHEDKSVREYLVEKGMFLPIDSAVDRVGDKLSAYVTQQLLEQQIGEIVLEYAIEEVGQNLNSMVAMVAMPAIRSSQDAIAERIDDIVRERCPELLKSYIEKEYTNWMDKPMKEVGIFLWERKEAIKGRIWEIYLEILEKKSGRFLERLDVSSIVEQKLNEFSMEELERLILAIAKRELNALVWIGGLLGAAIGFVNLLF